MQRWRQRGWTLTAGVLLLALLAGCASKTRVPAPVEDRSAGRRAPAAVVTEPPRPAASADAAVKPGQYVVRPGDTLIRIALDAGQNWRDIARWNNIENPNVIEVGQVLRVTPPASEVAVAKPVAPPAVSAAPMPPASAPAQPASA
ncbi:MAG TPA: LysM peptidoglycan-binding domain-containing protein, partial [Ramlibacter sp.]